MLRPLLFGLLLLASIAVLGANFRERQGQAAVRREPLEMAGADVSARIGIAGPGTSGTVPGGPGSQVPLQAALRHYRQLLRAYPRSEVIPRRIGVLTGYVEDPDAAWRWFRSHPDGAYQELWRAAYAPGALSEAELGAALRRLAALRFTWYGELVRARLYDKAGEDAQARQVLDRLRAQLRPGVMRLIFFVTPGLMALPVGALIWIGALSAYRRGDLRPVAARPPLAAIGRPALAEAFIVWFFGITVGGQAVGRALAASGMAREQLPLAAALGVAFAVQILAAVAGGIFLFAGARRGSADDGAPPAGRSATVEIGYGIVAYLAAVPLLVVTATLFSRLLPKVPTPPNPAMSLAMRAQGPREWLLLILMAVVAAPLFEELFFRGALYGALRRRAGAAPTIALTSLAFALVHPQLPLGFFPILALGVVFALVVELRRSLVPGIVAHMLNNGVALLLISVVRTP